MIIELKVPEAGESITEGMLGKWFKAEGELVKEGEDVVELETDKVTLAVPAPATGRLKTLVAEGETVAVGQVIGTIDTDAAGEIPTKTEAPAKIETAARPRAAPQTEISPAQKTTTVAAETGQESGRRLSPAVRRIVDEHHLDPGRLTGTGRGGALTKADVVAHLDAIAGQGEKTEATVSPDVLSRHPRETRKRMSPLRKRVAERLLEVRRNTAMVTTFNDVDMSAVLELRKSYREPFEAKHGVRLGFMSFFIKAAIEALREVPAINARIEGEDIVQLHYYDIAVAVSTDRGLVVPVVRDADQLSFAGIEKAISGLAQKARAGKLTLEELSGGSFTITNGGVFGSLLSTPMINPPQSGVLGLHRIEDRPVVNSDGQIVARPMMYLAVSYDHRLVDGAQAVTFLARVKACIENPGRILLEV